MKIMGDRKKIYCEGYVIGDAGKKRRNKCKKINGHFEVKTLGEE